MHSFESHIKGDKPVVVDFFAEWCNPCKLMAPVLEEVKATIGERATVLKMDIEKNPSYARQYGIQSVPTLVIFKEGKIIWRRSGLTSAHEIVDHLRYLLA